MAVAGVGCGARWRCWSSPRARPVAAAEELPTSPLLPPVVRFWVDVFTRWSVDDVVLHDRLEPETIYTVLRGPVAVRGGRPARGGCSRPASVSVACARSAGCARRSRTASSRRGSTGPIVEAALVREGLPPRARRAAAARVVLPSLGDVAGGCGRSLAAHRGDGAAARTAYRARARRAARSRPCERRGGPPSARPARGAPRLAARADGLQPRAGRRRACAPARRQRRSGRDHPPSRRARPRLRRAELLRRVPRRRYA